MTTEEHSSQLHPAAQLSESLYKTMSDSAPTGLWLSDEQGMLTYLNKTLVDMTGMPYDELLGAGWANAIIEQDKQRSIDAFLAAVSDRSHYEVQFRINTAEGKIAWCRAAGDPYYREDGSYCGYAGFCMNVNEEVITRQQLAYNEDIFRSLVELAPVATALFTGKDMVVEIANDTMLAYLGKDRSILGKPLTVGVPELLDQPFPDILEEVFRTGIAYEQKAAMAKLEVNGKLDTFYFDFTYRPLFNEEGEVYAIMDVSVNVTEEVIARRRLEESELFSRTIIDHSPIAKMVFSGMDMIIKTANQNMLTILGRTEAVLGMPFMEAIPELRHTTIMERLQQVFSTGETYLHPEEKIDLVRFGKSYTGYYNFIYKALYNTSNEIYGVMVTATEVTEQVLARKQLEEEKERANLAIGLTEIGVFEVDIPTNNTQTDKKFNEIFGFERPAKRNDYVAIFHPEDLAVRKNAHEILEKTGGYDYEARLVIPGQPLKWIRTKAKLLYDENGLPLKMLGLVQDITRQKEFEQSLAAQVRERTADLQKAQSSLEGYNAYLQDVLDNFDTPFAALTPVTENGEIVDFIFRKTNIAYSAYSNISPAQIENKTVGSVFPEYFKTDAFSKYVNTFTTGEFNSWELHYNVDHLNVHLRVNAKKLNDQVLVHFTDFSTLKNLELELLQKIEELERSNRNLGEFAYAASHDLKEPIRKIIFFSNMLFKSLENRLSQKEMHQFNRMDVAGKRMFSLIEDLLAFSRIDSQLPMEETVDLNQLVSTVLGDLELEIQQHNATVEVSRLFTLQGQQRQLQQVFQNLLSNALKYSQPEQDPYISINTFSTLGKNIPVQMSANEQEQHFRVISVTDNGIGFSQTDAERIFDVFTRLHVSNLVRGTGVGLSIVRKVMNNHQGHVRAESEPGKGSTFYLYFPVVRRN